MTRSPQISVALTALALSSGALFAMPALAQPAAAGEPAAPAAATPPSDAPAVADPAAPAAADAAAATDTAAAAELPPQGEPLPAEGLPLPVYVPPAEAPPPGAAPATDSKTSSGPSTEDEIKYSGYLPGYRRHLALGDGPVQPSVGALPGVTPGFGAPLPPNQWQFSFNGFMSLSAQVSFDQRNQPGEGQSATVTHVLPQTIDSYMHFTSTNSVPGNWVNLRFRYGTARVSANFSIDTYNPTAPTTFYQMGSQFFVNNAFLSYVPAPLGGLNLTIDAGRFGMNHGALSRYGNGIYTNLIAALVQGNGLRVQGAYDLDQDWQLVGEGDLMSTQDGTLPTGTIRSQENGWRRALWAGSIIGGAHLGFNYGKTTKYEFRLHYLTNRAYEDRLTAGQYDDATTRGINEKHLEDGSMNIYATDIKMLNDVYGVLGVGASYLQANNAFPLRGLVSYGGNGEELTERFLGVESGGTGNVMALGANYSVEMRQVLNRQFGGFDGVGPNVGINLGAQYSQISADSSFDGKARYKFGADVVYQPFKYVGIAMRADHVTPSSQDTGQSFDVIAPRLQFKTDWYSRETLQIMYAKWFFGPHTRNEGTGERSQAQLDDTLFALNLNMWW